MTDLREFTTGKVEGNPHDATRPSATVTMKADAKCEVTLSLLWVAGRPVAKWKVKGQEEQGYVVKVSSLFSWGGSEPIEGEEWKQGKKKEPEATAPEKAHPRPTDVLARLLPLAAAWEASPIRSADKLMRAIALALGPQQEVVA